MGLEFRQATRARNRLKMVLDGPAGCGKTFTALRLAHSLGEKVFVIDTQYGSASLYAGEKIDGKSWNFQHLTLTQVGTTDSEWGFRPLPPSRLSSRFVPGSAFVKLFKKRMLRRRNLFWNHRKSKRENTLQRKSPR